MAKKEENNEPAETEKKEEKKDAGNKDMKKYLLFAGLFAAFVLGILLTNFFNNMIFGRLSSENTNIIETLQQEKDELKEERDTAVSDYEELLAEKDSLVLTNTDLQDEVDHLENYLIELSEEPATEKTDLLRYYKASWKRYVLGTVGEEIKAEITIENLGVSTREYDLEVLLLSRYNNPTEGSPNVGSLNLEKGSSGKITVKLTPKEEGYAIYGLYVNGDLAGEMVVFVRG